MFDIIKSRYIYLWISSIIALFSVFVILFWNLNFWIDMTGGTQSEYTYTWTIDIHKIAVWVEELSKSVNLKNPWLINATNIYPISWESSIWLTIWFSTKLSDKELESYKIDFRNKVSEYLKTQNPSFNLKNYTNIWKSFWDYIKKTAIVTLTLSIIWISIYVMYAFSWFVTGISSSTFAIITWITLFHDVIVAAWLFIFTSFFFKEFQIDTFFITALLTILGYSINDTIVVFDRIRENLSKVSKKEKIELWKIINISVNETFARSIFTSSTVVIVLFAIFIFGPSSLKWFMLTMIYWTVFWTYSSIFVSATLLYEFNKNKTITHYEEKIVRIEDKIVV